MAFEDVVDRSPLLTIDEIGRGFLPPIRDTFGHDGRPARHGYNKVVDGASVVA